MSDEVILWVNQQLHSLLGYSEKTVEEFLIALAKSSENTENILKNFEGFDIPINEKTEKFAVELLRKVRKAFGYKGKSEGEKKKRKTEADLRREAKDYSIVEGNDGLVKEEERVRKKKKSKKKRKKSKNRGF